MASPKDILQLLSPLLKDWTFTSRINTQGQKTMDASTPVVLPSDQAAIPVTVAGLPLPVGAATEATLLLVTTQADFDTKTGSLVEAAPATDTASSGLNGRLQRIAQRITSLIALLPAALVGGRFDTNNGAWLGSTAPTVGQKTMANSVPVVLPSDQASIPVTAVLQSGSAAIGTVAQGGAGASAWLITVGTAATSLGKAEDSVAATGDTGVAVLAVRQDNPLPTASDSGDYANLAVDPNGRLWVNSGAQNLEPQARLQNLLLSRQAPSPESFNGFVPSETPSFLVGG